jgi:hypothetical protein
MSFGKLGLLQLLQAVHQIPGRVLCGGFRHLEPPSLLSVNAPIVLIRRHVILPKELAKTLQKGKLMSDPEWRAVGVQQSRGWEHYAIHK